MSAAVDSDDPDLVCANCGREPLDDENLSDDWRVESDGIGALWAFCPECWQREFGSSG
jgi:hypothetical protein